MDFTREPIIESVVTPREGCKIVVRSSKSSGQEEYFVDALEIVSFGHSFFFRCLERPKAFLVPVSDYEILEVREARMVLKNVGIDRAIKIGGGRDGQMRNVREQVVEKAETIVASEEYVTEIIGHQQPVPLVEEAKPDVRIEKKRDRRRHYRRRRGREEGAEDVREQTDGATDSQHVELPEQRPFNEEESAPEPMTTTSFLTSLLPPPQTLISDTIARYKDNALFRGAFYSKEEHKVSEVERKPEIFIEPPAYGSLELSEEEEEQIYQERKQLQSDDDEQTKGSETDIFTEPMHSESDKNLDDNM